MTLVTGATGNVGAELVRALAEAGRPVRALSRADRPDGAPPGVEAVAGDLSDEFAGRVLELIGPGPLLPADRVRVLGEVLGRDMRAVGLTHEEARAELESRMPTPYVDAFFGFCVDGTLDESVVVPTVHEVTGRAPRAFAAWARAHADAF
ncbi:NmrA family NAD(P)-binding protein [Streptomyces sp. NPDC058678]|uniref:NmrA family NAD(P)-binding protein n=1 Tax=Streptomyces sp. NPDC058678 TaxID=3346595 RepID=UPI003661BE05